MQVMSLNFALAQKENTSFTVDMCVISHNDNLNDSLNKLLMFMKNLTTHVPNYTQIYIPYSTVTSACQGSRLACTRTVSIFRMLTYMQTCFGHQNKPFCLGIGMK